MYPAGVAGAGELEGETTVFREQTFAFKKRE
jgi:hypothetical protein